MSRACVRIEAPTAGEVFIHTQLSFGPYRRGAFAPRGRLPLPSMRVLRSTLHVYVNPLILGLHMCQWKLHESPRGAAWRVLTKFKEAPQPVVYPLIGVSAPKALHHTAAPNSNTAASARTDAGKTESRNGGTGGGDTAEIPSHY